MRIRPVARSRVTLHNPTNQHRADGARATAPQIRRARAARLLQRQLRLAGSRRNKDHRHRSRAKRLQRRRRSDRRRWMECRRSRRRHSQAYRSRQISTRSQIAGPQPACPLQPPACAKAARASIKQKGPQPSSCGPFSFYNNLRFTSRLLSGACGPCGLALMTTSLRFL